VKPRIIDLDGSVRHQPALLNQFQPAVHDLRSWGKHLRLACAEEAFAHFETALAAALGSHYDDEPALSFLGSGDFHHITLALLHRIAQPFNLLVVDNHPDWMGGIPWLHCGTWLRHALELGQVRTVFHVGGDVDFDNRYRLLAPWQALRRGKVQVISSVRRFERGGWEELAFPSLRPEPETAATAARVEQLLEPFQGELARWPLYVSLDKDVMTARHATVNWDSGHLTLTEVERVLRGFIQAAGGRLVGMDIVGDWSPVRVSGVLRRLLHWTEHPWLHVVPALAAGCNQRTNETLLRCVNELVTEGIKTTEPLAA
jgi:arginase family enzyme